MDTLRDRNGNALTPYTKTDCVHDDNGNTLEEVLENMSGGSSGSSDEWTQSSLTSAASGYALSSYSSSERIVPNNLEDSDCNIFVADVVEYEKLKIVSSCKVGAYAEFVFVDNKGYSVAASQGSNYSTAIQTFEVTVPAGAVKVYINEYKSLNGSGSTVLYRKVLSGQAMASYNKAVADNIKLSKADLLKYYNLGASKMDTYNLIEEKVGFLVIGQSNADGRIAASDFPSSVTINGSSLEVSNSVPTCQIIQGDTSTTYGESSKNFAAYSNSGVWAFDQILYNAIANALGSNTFYVCKQTRGATSLQYQYSTSFWADIDDFKKNSGYSSQLYHLKLLVERALELQPDIKFKAIVMHQGETDYTLSKTEGAYYIALCKLIQWIRGLVGSPNLPFIFGTVPTNSAQYSSIIRADQLRVAQDMENVYVIDMGEAESFVSDGTGVHFGASDAESLADNMYQIMVNNKMLAPYV